MPIYIILSSSAVEKSLYRDENIKDGIFFLFYKWSLLHVELYLFQICTQTSKTSLSLSLNPFPHAAILQQTTFR